MQYKTRVVIITIVAVICSVIGVIAYQSDEPTPVPTVTAQASKTQVIGYTVPSEEISNEPINELVAEDHDYWGTTPIVEEIQETVVAKDIDVPTKIAPVVQPSTSREMSFLMNNGTYMTGAAIIDEALGNPNARKLWDQFNLHFGGEVANKAIISKKFENGTYWELTVGVCDPIHQINGDYRNCVYANRNSMGMDVGLTQINTYYQRYRIASLGGPSCEHLDSKDRNDPCNQQQIAWLHNVDNNIAVAVNLYAEQGFCPWYGYQRAFGGC